MSTAAEAGAVVAAGAAIGGYCYADTALCLWWARVRDRWSKAKTIVDHAAEPDHGDCEGGCGRTICCCAGTTADTVCVGTVEQACPHHWLLCGDCRLAECVDCRIDYIDSEVS